MVVSGQPTALPWSYESLIYLSSAAHGRPGQMLREPVAPAPLVRAGEADVTSLTRPIVLLDEVEASPPGSPCPAAPEWGRGHARA